MRYDKGNNVLSLLLLLSTSFMSVFVVSNDRKMSLKMLTSINSPTASNAFSITHKSNCL